MAEDRIATGLIGNLLPVGVHWVYSILATLKRRINHSILFAQSFPDGTNQ
jgi:hypothetical protein